MKSIVVLGSTGSIGTQTLEVVRRFPAEFRVVGLAAGTNMSLLKQQVEEFRPQFVAAGSPGEARWLKSGLSGSRLVPVEDMVVQPETELVVMATSGSAGLKPALAAIEAGKNLALASKEVLVMAGEIVMRKVREKGVALLPVDSEHSAIWQCLWAEENGVRDGQGRVSRIILTASGGPFRCLSREQMAAVTPAAALRHPTWRMGKKITIDSATLFNKGLEIIEAHWLFGMDYPDIEVVVHPESIIHSMVEFCDGSLKAQMSCPDMRLPIQLALSYPGRWSNNSLPRLSFRDVRTLTFEPPDTSRFPCLQLAREAGEKGGTYPAVASAADEVAVELFLSGKLGFMDIARLIEATLEGHQGTDNPDIETIVAADRWAKETARRLAKEPVC